MEKLSWPPTAMRSIRIGVLGFLCVVAAGTEAQQSNGAATVQMMSAQGASVGVVHVRQLALGTLFVADLRDLPPGGHAFHVHQHGDCEPPDFKSAGSHYSPLERKHGFDNRQGHHAGDLPNIHVSEDGTAKAEFFVPRFVLHPSSAGEGDSNGAITGAGGREGPFPLLDPDGSAIVVHENADNYRATPPDSAGSRIACGVIRAGN